MEIHITVDTDGSIQVETVSLLEDLWHDFLYFKARASELKVAPQARGDSFLVKRYCRSSLLALLAYLEGVANHWLAKLLTKSQWRKKQGLPLETKIETIHQCSLATSAVPAIGDVKRLRNMLVHLKPGLDCKLYEGIDLQVLDAAELQITSWLTQMEASLGLERHPNTRLESKRLTDGLGPISLGSEGHSGDS